MDSFKILEPIGAGFFAKNSEGLLSHLIPLDSYRKFGRRRMGAIKLDFQQNVEFVRPNAVETTSPAAIFLCASTAMELTFTALCSDIASRASTSDGRPSPERIVELVSEWEDLLRNPRQLSDEEEIGLWGELWLVDQSSDCDAALRAWRSPEKSVIDFVNGKVGIECKTAKHRLKHHVSHSQTGSLSDGLDVYFASLWIKLDDLDGVSLNELVSRIHDKTSDPLAFERALLKCGYSREQTDKYESRFCLLEEPLLFPREMIPRIRVYDEGITSIRYTVELQEYDALQEDEGAGILESVLH